ncbi:MAG TPA: phosphatase PAP2 family protein [Gemmatimonadales bacterium]|nr:phosphatase PAP2 family protein [Gemmatimonadales bacterium]
MTESGRRAAGAAALAAVLTAAALALDPWVWHHVEYAPIYDRDWGRLFRVFGSLVLWAPLALVVWLEGRAREPRSATRAWLLLLGPLLSGGVAEVLKMLFRRERPGLHEGASVFRSFSNHPFSTAALGMPSSHAMVAFGGAAVLARVFPRTSIVVYALAAGCAATRVLARAHFLSDVVVGALAGWAVGALLWNRFGAPRRSTAV